MNLRLVSLVIATLCTVPVARADQPTAVPEPVLVARATLPAVVAAERSAPTVRDVHGTLRGVLAAADHGPDALRQYVQRTRMIYGYRFEDFARAERYR